MTLCPRHHGVSDDAAVGYEAVAPIAFAVLDHGLQFPRRDITQIRAPAYQMLGVHTRLDASSKPDLVVIGDQCRWFPGGDNVGMRMGSWHVPSIRPADERSLMLWTAKGDNTCHPTALDSRI